MERLDNMYKALDALVQMGIPVIQEQKDMLAKLEEEYFDEELLPGIKSAVEEKVKDCQLPFKFLLTYSKEDGLSIEKVDEKRKLPTNDLGRRAYGERVYDRSQFSFEGQPFTNKIGFVHDFVERILLDHPAITYKQLKQMLPARSAANKFIISEPEWNLLTADAKSRYRTLPSESFLSSDGVRFFISTQWNITIFKETLLPVVRQMGYKWEQEER